MKFYLVAKNSHSVIKVMKAKLETIRACIFSDLIGNSYRVHNNAVSKRNQQRRYQVHMHLCKRVC